MMGKSETRPGVDHDARLARRVFVGGLALSVAVAGAWVLAAYLADSGPHLPATVATMEHYGVGPGVWPPPAQVAIRTRPATPAAPAEKVALLPQSPDPADAPPINLSDLPPPASHIP
jgi:hypothetical protein